jgi:hypothetical protein
MSAGRLGADAESNSDSAASKPNSVLNLDAPMFEGLSSSHQLRAGLAALHRSPRVTIVALIRKGVADGSKPDNCDPGDGIVHLIKIGRAHLNA